MATQREIDEADVRARIDTLAESIRAHDLETAMTLYARDMVSFDFEPPLQHVGADAKRRNWVAAFAAYERPLGYEIHDLTIAVGDEVAFTHSLNRISGTLKNGSRTDFWLRATTGLRKIDGNWLITHDQVSVPLDFETGTALLNLTP
jgi:ketosteroid isomerase-like protein